MTSSATEYDVHLLDGDGRCNDIDSCTTIEQATALMVRCIDTGECDTAVIERHDLEVTINPFDGTEDEIAAERRTVIGWYGDPIAFRLWTEGQR